MKKRIMALLICAAVVLSLTGCKDSNNEVPNDSTPTSTSEKPGNNSSSSDTQSSADNQSTTESTESGDSKPENSEQSSSKPEENSKPEESSKHSSNTSTPASNSSKPAPASSSKPTPASSSKPIEQNPTPAVNGKTPAEKTSSLLDAVEFPEMRKLETADDLTAILGVNADDLTDYSVYICPSGMSPDEFGVLVAKDEETAAAIKTTIESRIQYQNDTFKDYPLAAEQVYKLNDAFVETNGNTVYYAICADSTKAKEILG